MVDPGFSRAATAEGRDFERRYATISTIGSFPGVETPGYHQKTATRSKT
jgi:hypothetical protein